MIFVAPETGPRNTGDWRFRLSMLLLFLAAIPVQIYAVPGFEITPALLLAPVALLLFQPTEKAHYAVVAFMAFCGLLALAGMTGSDGRIRNLIGAASYSSGAPYILVGMVFANRNVDLSGMWKFVTPVAALVALIFLVDLYLTGGNLIRSAAYISVSYHAPETVYVQSAFPFYGKYAVITLATIAMMLGGLSIASTDAFEGWPLKTAILVLSTVLVFLAFSMSSRQVMIGGLVFYVALIIMAFRRRETWISVAIFLVLLLPWSYAQMGGTFPSAIGGSPSTVAISNNKLVTSFHNFESGNLDRLSTGRLPLYRKAIGDITPRIALGGCGFCNLMDVLKFKFSSLHNVVLTAVYKGGFIYAALYLGVAFSGLLMFWLVKKSFARDATIAVVASIGVQALFNDVVYFQVVPAMLFVLAGYLYSVRRGRFRYT